MDKIILILALFGLALLPLLAQIERFAHELIFKSSLVDASLYIFRFPLVYLFLFFTGLSVYAISDFIIKRRKK